MRCHPSHRLIFFKMVIAPPTPNLCKSETKSQSPTITTYHNYGAMIMEGDPSLSLSASGSWHDCRHWDKNSRARLPDPIWRKPAGCKNRFHFLSDQRFWVNFGIFWGSVTEIQDFVQDFAPTSICE